MSEWFKTGFDGYGAAKAEEERRREDAMARALVPWRFWMPKDTKTTVVFLGGIAQKEPFQFWEHNLQVGGSWKNWYVCLKKNLGTDCPICKFVKDPYWVGMWSCIEFRPWTDKKGTVHHATKLIFPAKGKVLEILKDEEERRKGLRGCVFEIKRTSDDNSPNCGDVFTFIEKKEVPAKIKVETTEIETVPFNFAEVIKPSTVDDLKKIIGKVDDAESTYIGKDKSVPF